MSHVDPDDWQTKIKALICDTGGTVFDWHTAVADGFAEVGRSRKIDADWASLTKTWRRLSTGMVDRGLPSEAGTATMDMDDVLLVTLDQTLQEHGIERFSEHDRRHLVLSWRNMRAWPDVQPGLHLLRSRFLVAPFTILKTALVMEASRRSEVEWDAVISCEMIGVYKTAPLTYATAMKWLDQPREAMLLVTTHNNDLEAAHHFGFHTAFVLRPAEWSDLPSADPDPSPLADIVADDFVDLARQLPVASVST